jgi:hypothetical protein
MALPLGALFNPGADGGDFGNGERLAVGVRRRHAAGGRFRSDAAENFGDGKIPGNIEAESGFARDLVGTVAGKAAVGEDGTDVAGEIDLGSCAEL